MASRPDPAAAQVALAALGALAARLREVPAEVLHPHPDLGDAAADARLQEWLDAIVETSRALAVRADASAEALRTLAGVGAESPAAPAELRVPRPTW
jgi:hypothetical protein